MSERVNGREPSIKLQQKYHAAERPGILSVASDDLLRRRQQSQSDRQRMLEKLRALDEQKKSGLAADSIDEQLGLFPETFLTGTEVILPITRHEQAIVDMVNNNRASILISETGGGKSTQLPQFLINAGYDHVYVIQGRRVMVDGLAARIQEEVEGKIGEDAAEGYVESIHGGRAITHSNSKITVATAASLVRMMPKIVRTKGDKRIGFIADEIHEDDQYVETAVGVVGIATMEHPEWRLVAASATIDPEPIKIPLGRITDFKHPERVEVPVYRVEGRPFTLETHEAPTMNPAQAFLATGAEHKVAALASRGYDQMKRMRETVIEGYEQRAPGSSENLIFKEFSGRISPHQRERIAELAADMPDGMQLVVLGTPALRSGVTIPGMTWLGYDGMINRERRREDRSRGLIADYASQAEVTQFFGRAGRNVSGAQVYLCAPMPSRTSDDAQKTFASIYPFTPMLDRKEYPEPAIFNSNLSELILNGVTAGAKPDIFNKMILTEQDHQTLRAAVKRLRSEFGAIDENDTITEIGRLMSRFPVAPELARGLAEAMMNGRSREQLGRMAVVATAIDAGGLQSSRKSMENAQWTHLLRSGSDDDFIAQLDLMLAYNEAGFKKYGNADGFQFAYNNDLDYGRILSIDEPTDKVMRRLGIDPYDFELEPPSYEEIRQIREDFTAGMYGLTYREITRKSNKDDKNHYFRPVRGADVFPERQLAAYSVLEPRRNEVIAGMPQFYERIRKGELGEVETIAATLKVDVKVVGRYALAGNLVDYVTVPNSARRDGGMFVESLEGRFGSLHVDSFKKSAPTDEIPKETQARIVESIQNNPGDALFDLRALATTLAQYRRTLPAAIIEQYRRPGAPVDVTLDYIANLLKGYAARTRNVQEIDALIEAHVDKNSLFIDLYYDVSAREEMLERSPAEIYLGEGVKPLTITYDNGWPYAKNVTQDQLAAISGPIFIDEGHAQRREVLMQQKKPGGRGVHRVSFGAREEEN